VASGPSIRRWVSGRLRRRRPGDGDLDAVLELYLTGGDNPQPRLQSVDDRHLAVPARSGLDRGANRFEDRFSLPVRAVLSDHIDAVAVERVVDRGLGEDDHVRLRRQYDRSIVAWTIIVRVSALTCGSIVVISASKFLPR